MQTTLDSVNGLYVYANKAQQCELLYLIETITLSPENGVIFSLSVSSHAPQWDDRVIVIAMHSEHGDTSPRIEGIPSLGTDKVI